MPGEAPEGGTPRAGTGRSPSVTAAALVLVLVLAAIGSAGCRDQSPPEPERRLESLRSLPYANWRPVPEQDRGKIGVTRHDVERAYAGLNFYQSRPRHEALLITMDGDVVHTWSSPMGQPTSTRVREILPWADLEGWHHVEPAPNGDVYAIVYYHMLLRLDRSSGVVWSVEIPAHHDVALAPDGSVYTLGATRRTLDDGFPILDSTIIILSPAGEVSGQHSLHDILEASPLTRDLLEARILDCRSARRRWIAGAEERTGWLAEASAALQAALQGAFEGEERETFYLLTEAPGADPLHANSIEILDTDVPGLGARGDLLLSLRNMDLILTVDLDEERVLWAWGPGEILAQHQPSVVRGRKVLLFDNGWRREPEHSRIVEMDPVTGRIEWEYVGDPPESFFSKIRGSVQALPNANLLVTDSERGRAFEITRSGETVWEFFNPDLRDPYLGRERAPIYRMVRLDEAFRTAVRDGALPAP